MTPCDLMRAYPVPLWLVEPVEYDTGESPDWYAGGI